MANNLSTFWHQIRRDKLLILLCLILAFLGWQGIRKNIGFEVTVSNIEVEVDAPAGWAVWEKSARGVSIEFDGSREDIRYLNNEQLRVIIPVPDPERGAEMTFTLSDKFLQNPTGARAVSFSPAQVTLRLDQEAERLLPVKAAIKGALPKGLEIERVVCVPASVRVSGARQALEAMENIQTEPVELGNRQSSFKESARVALPQTGRVTAEPEWVTVEFVLEARDAEAKYEKVPVRVMCAPGERRSITISPETINVTVKGQQQRVEQTRTADVFAYVSCHDLTESTTYELPVTVDLPTGLRIVKTEPVVVRVEISNTN